MSLNKIFKTSALILVALFVFTPISYAGAPVELPETDTYDFQLFSFFDLRDRE